MTIHRLSAFLAMGAAASVGCIHAEGAHYPAREIPTVRVAATAFAQGAPDQARVEITIKSDAESAEKAGAAVAAKQRALREALVAIVGQAGQIEAGPTSSWRPYSARPSVVQQASWVRADLHDLALVPAVLRAARKHLVPDGDLSLSLFRRDPRALRAQAIDEATREARTQAELVARSLGVSVAGLQVVEVKLSERLEAPVDGNVVRAVSDDQAPFVAAPDTIEVRVDVSLSAAMTSR